MIKNPKVIQIKIEDGPVLPGLLYEAPKSKKIAIRLHGNGSSSVFYYDDQRDEQVESLNDKGISFLLFNNRGAHYIKKLDVVKRGKIERKRFGMAYEKIKDCVKDIDGAISYLTKLGYREFYLIGESTGANKICVYDYYKPKNRVSKYILLGGGDDTGIYYDMLGRKKFYKLLKESREKIKQGRGEEIIKEILPDLIFSYIGFYDIANPDGDYNVFPFLEVIKNIKLSTKASFRYFRTIKKPTLVIYGEKDEYAWGDAFRVVDILKSQNPKLDYRVIKGADHGFSEHQKELSKMISVWLVK
jgi:pimeloyl-ACP methyl ester carboxylesterase